LILAGFLFVDNANATPVSSPTLLEIKQDGALNFLNPLVIGLTQKGTEVLVYIDEEFIDFAEVNESKTDTNNFYFRIKEKLEIGQHKLVVQARDRKSLVLSSLTSEHYFYIKPLPSPTLVAPIEFEIIEDPRPQITGFTISGTKVNFYIDGELNGRTEIIFHKSGTANFSYISPLILSPGRHIVSLTSEDEQGNISEKTKPVEFYIEYPLPAPVLSEKYYLNKENILTIAGNAKNDLEIKVFIDSEFKDKIKVINHESGTANFAYVVEKPLTNETHSVYATSLDGNGKESKLSNILSINIEIASTTSQAKPRITEEAVEEVAQENIGDIDKEDLKPEIAIIDPEKITKEDIQKIDDLSKDIFSIPEDNEVIEDVLEEKNKKALESLKNNGEESNQEKPEEKTGLMNEDNEEQGKMDWSLFVFFLFLLAVVVWIFWVNRELIKEKQAKSEEAEKKEESNDEADKFQNNLKI